VDKVRQVQLSGYVIHMRIELLLDHAESSKRDKQDIYKMIISVFVRAHSTVVYVPIRWFLVVS